MLGFQPSWACRTATHLTTNREIFQGLLQLLWIRASAPQHRRSLILHDRRRVPFAGQGLTLWGVEAHGQIERRLRGGQPVGLFASTRTVVLEVQVERTIGIV